MRMNDYAHEWTDKQLASLEKKISREYGIALKELNQKQTDFMKGYEVGLSNKKSQLANGEISKQEFNEWLDSQALRSTWLNDMVNSCSQIANNTNKAALDMVNGSMAGFYAENYNWGTYQIEKGTNINTAFNLVDADTVRGMLADNPNLLPKYNLDTLKDLRWNNQKFNSAILQGILQGESIPDISKRLQSVMQMNHNSAVRNARTATTAAENKGRIDSYKRAEKMVIEVKKEWLATLDGRTRHSHRQLDGVSVGTDEKFDNGCRFPGDPQAPGFEVYNCRCTLIANLPDVDTSGAPRNSKLGNMSYDEWKNELAKEAPKSTGAVNYFANASDDAIDGLRRMIAKSPYKDELGVVNVDDLSADDVRRIADEVYKKDYDRISSVLNGIDLSSIDSMSMTDKIKYLEDLQKEMASYTMNDMQVYQTYSLMKHRGHIPDVVDDLSSVDGVGIYRGVQNSKRVGVSGRAINDMTKYAEHSYVGNGDFGHGLYFGNDLKIAERYTRGNGDVLAAKIKPDARLIEFSDLQQKAIEHGYATINGGYFDVIDDLFYDKESMYSILAEELGYQGIKISDKGYYVILDKRALWVQR